MPTDTKIDDATVEAMVAAYEREMNNGPLSASSNPTDHMPRMMTAMRAALSILPALPQPTGEDAKLVAAALRQASVVDYLPAEDVSKAETSELLRNVAARLSALSAELEGAREALEPFARCADIKPILAGRGTNTRERNPDDATAYDWSSRITWGMVRRARAALATDRQPSKESA